MIDLAAARVGAILNTSSGSCDEGAQQELETILQEHGIAPAQGWCGGGEEIEGALDEAMAARLDVLVVLGGDGTIRTAAEACAGSAVKLIPLPGGTMNMLPKPLYGDVSWQEALRATLAAPKEQGVAAGEIGDHRFFVAAILGEATLFTHAREALRDGDIGGAISQGLSALSSAFSGSLDYDFDGEAGSAQALSIMCPLASKVLDDEEQCLEAAALSVGNPAHAALLLSRAAISDWREDPNVACRRAQVVNVRSKTPINAVLDGETVTLGREAVVRFRPSAVTVLVPAA